MPRALGRCVVPRAPLALLGQSLSGRPPGGGLLANAMRVRRSLLLQPGGGGCSSSVLTDTLL